MFKSFSSKFFILYALMTLFVSLIFFGVIMTEIKDHYIDIRQNVMIDESKSIANQYKSAYIDKITSKVAFIYQLSALGKNVNSRILIADANKNIIIDSEASEQSLAGTSVNVKFVNKTFAGESKKEIQKS